MKDEGQTKARTTAHLFGSVEEVRQSANAFFLNTRPIVFDAEAMLFSDPTEFYVYARRAPLTPSLQRVESVLQKIQRSLTNLTPITTYITRASLVQIKDELDAFSARPVLDQCDGVPGSVGEKEDLLAEA